MPNYFPDTSALGKRYHPETGTPRVEKIFQAPGARWFISQLTSVEVHSVFAAKVRAGLIAATNQFKRSVVILCQFRSSLETSEP